MRRPCKAVVTPWQDSDAAPTHRLHAFNGCFQLAVIAHLASDFGRQAPLRRVVTGVDQPCQARCHVVLELICFEHVQRFCVGEACVIDNFDALLDAFLDSPAGPRMRRYALAPGLGLFNAHTHFFGCELAHLRRHASDGFARKVDLDAVDAVLGEHAHTAAHFFGAAHDSAKGKLMLRQVRRSSVAQAARHRDLLAGCQVARADDGAVVDGVADHHVEPRLGGCGAYAAGPTHVEVLLRNLGTPQDVLFRRHALNGI